MALHKKRASRKFYDVEQLSGSKIMFTYVNKLI